MTEIVEEYEEYEEEEEEEIVEEVSGRLLTGSCTQIVKYNTVFPSFSSLYLVYLSVD